MNVIRRMNLFKKKKRKAKSLDVPKDNMDQTTAKKIKLENPIDESDHVSSETVNVVEESEPKKINYSVEELKKKIEILSSKDNLTKSARKNLAKLKKKLSVQENISATALPKKQVEEEFTEEACGSDVTVDDKETSVEKEYSVQQPAKKTHNTKNEKNLNKKNKNEVPSNKIKKENVNNIKTLSNKEEAEENKTNRINQSKKEIAKEQQQKKTRHILFVGNIPYGATVEEIKNHFLKEVSQVISVRIPTVKKTNEPRGFAYVEFSNSIDYEKGLSLHHSQLNGRRINVQYTQSGSKNAGKKSEIIKKNQLLHSLRKQGKLAGNKNFKSRQNFKKFQETNKF
ncbi:Similar to SPBC365.04c: Uncharacterized RNA-binding protein C365.04c (Schizosaccharomyces pombe (strain 972 / ATCC 24843)) [Cotesia congregata]|uniref:Similar to SPBC365.04c: Uncharacterized RNA-binding protein C365.04c (Schizosaccharomyces pombe (Strain 972 / ATCC 24843)) n=1 Tax=Cotesia congregata TaxID=51543 RepID=A0A8J2HI93_COTCN|nr:Similar to SPBC365.04c: Uncharacterized RNA-binding protein C365.04c (Schizosaccharomyces pombe (strain 972 / ATCC 24843)) [Cotesia congregata]